MNGKLINNGKGWFIEYKMDTDLIASDGGLIPLHPDDIEKYVQYIDNGRLKHKYENQEVEFDMIEVLDRRQIVDRMVVVAKLNNP